MELLVDSIQIRGPKSSDNSYAITFTTGEYQAKSVAALLLYIAEGDSTYKITVDKQ